MCMAKVMSFLGRVGKGIVSVLIENGKLSVGRLLLISVFILAVVRWSQGVDIPSTMVTVLMSLLAYIMGGKVVGNVSETIKGVKGVVSQVKEVTGIGSEKTPDIDD